MGGPFWGAEMHNVDFVERLISSVKAFPNRFGTAERMLGNLTMVAEVSCFDSCK